MALWYNLKTMSREFTDSTVPFSQQRGISDRVHGEINEIRTAVDQPLWDYNREVSMLPFSLSFDAYIAVRDSVALTKEQLLQTKTGIQNVYRDIQAEAGPIDMLVYPASSGDSFPILCTSNLVMIDASPFTAEGMRFDKAAKHVDKNLLSAFSFKELAEHPETKEATQRDLLRMREDAVIQISAHFMAGFQQVDAPWTLEKIMGSLYSIGVHPFDVSLQSIPYGHRLSFELDKQKKHIYYIQMRLPHEGVGDERYKTATDFIAQATAENNVQRTGVLVKADYKVVAPGLIRKYQPDVLIHDWSWAEGMGDLDIQQKYNEASLGGTDDRYNNILFGYVRTPTKITIGN